MLVGYPLSWDEPKTPQEAMSLMIDKNPAMALLVDRLALVPLSFTKT